MIDELVDLLHREAAAADHVAARTRALELIVAAGERRFLGMALDELESASERLSGLELTRSLTFVAAGLSPDMSAAELVAAVADPGERSMLQAAIDDLREATGRLTDARTRATAVIHRNRADTRARLTAAEALAAS